MKKTVFALLAAAFIGTFCFAEETPVKDLYSYKLDNGLNLFVAENHSVPLTYIEIAVRCGAYTQTEKTSGLFHLYEHMMFKGNSLYKDAAEVTKALSELGVSDWNGTTDLECVNYYFTVPSYMTEKGLEFWNAAIRSPKLDKKEFENEKKVVLSEINADYGEKIRIAVKEKNSLIFHEAPYKLSPGGSLDVISNATVKQLKTMQKRFYIPNNVFLFVGGDVNPDEVYELTKKLFGSWKKGADPFENKKSNPDRLVQFDKNPFKETVFAVIPYDKMSPEMARITVEFRGPDAGFEENDTYAADILSNLMENPSGLYKQTLAMDPLLFVPDVNYSWAGYYTRKTCGVFSFGCSVVNPSSSLPERAQYFAESIPSLVTGVAKSTDEELLKKVVNRIEDKAKWENQTASGILSVLRFWCMVTKPEYFYTYSENMEKVNPQMLEDFNYKYFVGKKPIVTILVNPKVYEMNKSEYEENGFIVLGEGKIGEVNQ